MPISKTNIASRIDALALDSRLAAGKPVIGLFAIAIFVWGLDFKASSSGGGAAVQSVISIIYTAFLLWVTVTAAGRGAGAGPLWMVIVATLVFMTDSSIVGLNADQPFYAIFVNLIPPFIYLSASSLTYMTLLVSENHLPAFLRVIRVACLAFAIVHIVIVVVMRGSIDVTSSRFEVLSGAVIPALGIAALALIERVTRFDVVILLFNLMVTLLSVTRTLFVVMAAQIVGVFLARPAIMFKSTTFKGVTIIGLLMLILVGLDYAAGTGLVERWYDRLTVSERMGGDPTALTRGAETHFMYESFTATAESALFGNGLASITSLTGPDAERAARLVGWQAVNLHDIGYGHESYASILFVAGLVGGGGLLIIQLVNAVQAVALIRRVQIERVLYGEAGAHIAAWGAIIVIGDFASGFLFGTIGERATCLWYGIGTGVLYWARDLKKSPA